MALCRMKVSLINTYFCLLNYFITIILRDFKFHSQLNGIYNGISIKTTIFKAYIFT